MSHQRPIAERSDSGGLMLRFDDVLLLRGNRGTWLLDLQTEEGHARRHIQVPIGRHKVFDRFALELLGENSKPSSAHDESQA
jgi:hypothetical protein